MKAHTLYIFTLLMMNEAVSRQEQEKQCGCRTVSEDKHSPKFNKAFGNSGMKDKILPSGEDGSLNKQ